MLPPVLDVELDRVGQPPGQDIDFGTLAMPGFIIMAVVFVAQVMSDDVWVEKQQGTLRRAIAAPRGLAGFLGGKVLAGAVLVALASAGGLGLGRCSSGSPCASCPAPSSGAPSRGWRCSRFCCSSSSWRPAAGRAASST